ncbi:MAG: hypothetical protein CVU43_07760 [Chloroflexi bacterium HGW-Chloroflexi-5]|jgi:competence protein ComEC|nr:MAG: hypothetical protein CVU43_07760 [Chloroflexi bacterium HGW-Chloroflexi-5]
MPLLWVSLAFIAGLLAGDDLQLRFPVWLTFSVLFLLLSIFEHKLHNRFQIWRKVRQWLPLSAGVMLLFFTLGGLRIWMTNNPVIKSDDLAWYNNKGAFVVTGWVSAAPDRRTKATYYQISTIEITDPASTDWVHAARKIHGVARVQMPADATWQYGDLLQFTAYPRTPSDHSDFSYRDYLAKSGILSVIYHPRSVTKVGNGYGTVLRKGLISFREQARQTLFEIYPQPEAGLLTGILLGVDNDLPPALSQDYRDTGVAHIIAISGFNMAVLAGLFLWAFTLLVGPYWAAFIAAILLGFYASMVDASESVTRAVIMAVMAMGGHLIGRRQAGLNALMFTAAVMCLLQPLLLKDASFQLSFAASFGLVVFAQPMQDWLKALLEKKVSEKTAAKWAKPFSEYFLFTLAAQLATLPFIAANFGRISISSLLANPLVLPVQPAVMISGGLTLLAGMLHPLAGKLTMLISWPFLKYTNVMVTLLAKIKGGVLTIHPAFTIWIFVVVIIFVILFFLREKLARFFQSSRFVWLVLLLVATGFSTWSIASHQPDGKLHLHLVRCDEESALYLIAPNGRTLAIDPRGSMDEFTSSLENELSPWSFHLDSVLITDRKLSEPMAELSGAISVRQVLLAPSSYRAEEDSRPLRIPDGITVEKLLPAENVEIEPGVWLTLAAEDLNGTALLLQYGSLRILVPNGVDYAVIKTSTPEALTGLTALLLGPEDISYIPPRVWRNLNSQMILWRDRGISPFEDSLGVDVSAEVRLVADGTDAWLMK